MSGLCTESESNCAVTQRTAQIPADFWIVPTAIAEAMRNSFARLNSDCYR